MNGCFPTKSITLTLSNTLHTDFMRTAVLKFLNSKFVCVFGTHERTVTSLMVFIV